MKKLYILFLFVFEFKVQGSICEKLDIENLVQCKELLEIQQAYKVLSPLKNETPNYALCCLLRGYEKDMPYMQHISQEEENKQKKELQRAYKLLKSYGLHDKFKSDIDSFLKKGLSPKQLENLNDDDIDESIFKAIDEACELFTKSIELDLSSQSSQGLTSQCLEAQESQKNDTQNRLIAKNNLDQREETPSFYKILDDNDELNASIFKEIDEACLFSQQSQFSMNEHSQIQQDENNDDIRDNSIVSTASFFSNQSTQNLDQNSKILEALQIIGLTYEDFNEESILIKECEYDEDSSYMCPEKYAHIKKLISFLKSQIIQ